MTAANTWIPAVLPPALRWTGPGRTAFAGAAGGSGTGRIAEIGSAAEIREAFGDAGDPELLRSLAAYFERGGGTCAVLDLPPLHALPAEKRAASWMGEDGGPGYRTGLCSLLDREDVGAIAAPGLRDPALRRRLASLAEARKDCLVVLDSSPAGGVEDLPASGRLVVAEGWKEMPGGGLLPPSGPFLGDLEARDFRETNPGPALAVLASGPSTASPLAKAMAWRVREGLRRSIDQGTRWVVFEPNRDFLWRRVEREVGAFLARLLRLGLLEGGSPEEDFRVRCRAGAPEDEGLLVLEIDVKIRGAGETSRLRSGGIAGRPEEPKAMQDKMEKETRP